MTTRSSELPIPRGDALRLCGQLRREQRGKWWTFGGLMCWSCVRFSGGDAARMCVSSRPGFRGCLQVNRRYERESR